MKDVTVILGVIGSDSHTIGSWVLRHALKEAGFSVVQLGSCVSQEEFIGAANETNASAILVSSIYGHGRIDCEGFKKKCIEAGLQDVLLYIGGNLGVVRATEFESVEKEFKDLGFDRVYPPGVSPSVAIADLKKDLKLQ